MQMVFLLDAVSACSLIPLVLLILFIIHPIYASSKPQRKLPPSPPKLPIVGNLFQLGLHPHRSLHSLSEKYGPLMLLHLGSRPTVVASSVDAAREILKTHDLIFSNRPKSSIPDRLLYGSKDVAFTAYGEYWRQVKSICVLHLLSNKRVQSYQQVREEETSLMIEKIKQMCSSSSSSSLINLSDVIVKLTSDLICRVALGRKYCEGKNGEKIKEMLVEFIELLGVFSVGDYIPCLGWVDRVNGLDGRLYKVSKDMDEFLEKVIEEHKERKTGSVDDGIGTEARGSDFVDILLQVQKENMTGFQLDRETLKAVIMDVFAAGADTTSTVMDWAMVEILRHPKVLKQLQIEVRQLAQEKSEITEDALHKMQYLKAVIKETCRLHPPLPLLVPRELTQNVKLMGYDLSAGTQVLLNTWTIGRDPMLWEKPEEFLPERFLNSDIDFRGLNFELIPFGAGRRGCPGVTFAMAINELALAKLLHKFDFALPDGTKPEEMDMTEATGITIHRKLPLTVVATPYSG